MAPEVVRGQKYDEKCDVFSFGILWFALWCEKTRPYAGHQQQLNKSMFNIELKVAQDPNFRPQFTDEFLLDVNKNECWMKESIEKCWNDNPEERPSFITLFDLFKSHIPSTII